MSSPKFSKEKCKCGRPLKEKLLDKKNTPVCYRCYCKSESLRGHHINNKPRQKRVSAGVPVKNFNKRSPADV